jgi:hypothetical protein
MDKHAPERAERADEYTVQADDKPAPPRLVDRVEQLENVLAELAERLDTNTSAIARVGSRLTRAEMHIGLPSTDVYAE